MANVYLNLVTENEKKLGQELIKIQRESDRYKKKWSEAQKAVKANSQEVKKLDRQVATLSNQVERYKGKFEDADKAARRGVHGIKGMKSGLVEVGAQVGSLAASWAGPAAMVAAVTADLKKQYDIIKKNKEEAATMHVDAGQARAAALLNLPRDFEGGMKEFDTMVERIADKAQLPLKDVYTASSSALSAKGSATNEQFESSLTLASKAQANTGGKVEAGPLSGSLLDVMKNTGITDAEAALGWVRQSGAAARITTLEGQLRMIPGIGAAMSNGDTAEQAMEIQAAISQIIGDSSGEKTASGFINLVNDLNTKDLVPYKKANKSRKLETKFKPVEGTNTYEKMANLQAAYSKADEEGQREIINKIGGRAGMAPFITAMLKRTDQYNKTIAGAKAQVAAPDKSAAAESKEYFKNVFKGNLGRVLKEDLKTKAIADSMESKQSVGAMEQKAWERYSTVVTKMGYDPGNRMSQEFGTFLGGLLGGQKHTLPEQLAGRLAYLKDDPLRRGMKDNPIIDNVISELVGMGQTIKQIQAESKTIERPSVTPRQAPKARQTINEIPIPVAESSTDNSAIKEMTTAIKENSKLLRKTLEEKKNNRQPMIAQSEKSSRPVYINNQDGVD